MDRRLASILSFAWDALHPLWQRYTTATRLLDFHGNSAWELRRNVNTPDDVRQNRDLSDIDARQWVKMITKGYDGDLIFGITQKQ